MSIETCMYIETCKHSQLVKMQLQLSALKHSNNTLQLNLQSSTLHLF